MIINSILIFLFLVFLNIFQKKYNILCHDNSLSLHKKIGSNKIPLSGGIYFYIIILIFSLFNFFSFFNFGFEFLVALTFFLILGLTIDSGYEIKPKLRLLIQIIIVLSFLIKTDLFVNYTKIFFLDFLLEYKFFSFIFTTFCIVILINGVNFIDGVNGNSSGYLFLVFLFFLYLLDSYKFISNFTDFKFLILYILFFFIFNLLDKNYLGECGNYILGFTIAIFVIKFFNENNVFSPLYAVSILWYPAFENLFSILRKIFIDKKNAFVADTSHLHTLIFVYFKKCGYNKKSNSLTGLIINIYMIPGFIFSNIFSSNSKILFFIIVINLTVYMLIYFNLKKFNLSEKK